MNCKGNFLCKFSSLDPSVKCFLLKSYCLLLYGCSLRSLSTPSLRAIEVALHRILGRIWNLLQRSHTSIVHCTAEVPTVSHIVYNGFCSLLLSVLSSPSMFLKSIYTVYLFFYWLSQSMVVLWTRSWPIMPVHSKIRIYTFTSVIIHFLHHRIIAKVNIYVYLKFGEN